MFIVIQRGCNTTVGEVLLWSQGVMELFTGGKLVTMQVPTVTLKTKEEIIVIPLYADPSTGPLKIKEINTAYEIEKSIDDAWLYRNE